jgi:hypothetical protein
MIARPRDEWIIPEQPTHAPLIDVPTFEKAQELLAKLPKRPYYAPRTDMFWLKPILYCAGCGRGMVGKTIRGKAHYHCLTSVYRSNRPGDSRFHTDCGFNCVSHDEVLELLTRKLDRLKLEVEEAIEQGGLKLRLPHPGNLTRSSLRGRANATEGHPPGSLDDPEVLDRDQDRQVGGAKPRPASVAVGSQGLRAPNLSQ